MEPDNDPFLGAVEKIRNDQKVKKKEQLRKERLRTSNSKKWEEILTKGEAKSLEKYKENLNSQKLPINVVNGVEIEMATGNEKKSQKRDLSKLLPEVLLKTLKIMVNIHEIILRFLRFH